MLKRRFHKQRNTSQPNFLLFILSPHHPTWWPKAVISTRLSSRVTDFWWTLITTNQWNVRTMSNHRVNRNLFQAFHVTILFMNEKDEQRNISQPNIVLFILPPHHPTWWPKQLYNTRLSSRVTDFWWTLITTNQWNVRTMSNHRVNGNLFQAFHVTIIFMNENDEQRNISQPSIVLFILPPHHPTWWPKQLTQGSHHG